jgi:hypothetical protein
VCSSSSNGDAGAGASIPAEEIRQNLKSKTVQFVFEKALTEIYESSITLKVEYMSFLNNRMAGFYRSYYTDIDGNKKSWHRHSLNRSMLVAPFHVSTNHPPRLSLQ